MALKLVTAPTEEPVTLQEVKDYLRVDTTDDDALLDAYIKMARTYAEGVTGRAYVTQTWDLYMDRFPVGRLLVIPRPPLVSITSVKYYDTDETEATFAASNYQVDIASEPGRIALGDGKSWPTTSLRPINGVVVQFVAGSAVASVNPIFRQAIFALIAHFYEYREEFVTGTIVSRVPDHLTALLWHDRVMLNL